MKINDEKTFVQVWDYLLENDELDVSDVLLLSKVISLHLTKDGCYMTNDYVSKMLRLKNVETASRRITKLQKLGYVELRYVPSPTNPKKTNRFIIPTYENGLTQKLNRVDLEINTPLTLKSTPIDLKVNTLLTLKSTPPCLESQSIISENKIIEKINLKDQLEYIKKIILEDKFDNADARGDAYFERHKLEKILNEQDTLTTK